MPLVYTLGHSTHTIERFVALLEQHGVNAVADVRSRPFSRMNAQFNRDELRRSLGSVGVAYVFLGDELGARPKDRACYEQGRARHERIAATALFGRGLDRVVDGAARFRVALVCAEKDPMTCHRAILVGRHLVARGVEVNHILADGAIESHTDALARAADEEGVSMRDLFRTRDEIFDEVYARRSSSIEYVEQDAEEKPR